MKRNGIEAQADDGSSAALSAIESMAAQAIALAQQALTEVSMVSGMISENSKTISEMDDDIAETDIGWPGDGGAAAYFSFFKVIDLSSGGVCKVGVTDGGWLDEDDPPQYCGTVKINGDSVNVECDDETLTAEGIYYIWLHMWLDSAEGPKAKIIFGAADSTEKPDNPNGGIAFASHLLGRVEVENTGTVEEIVELTQDYLSGSEHIETLWGDCDGNVIDCPVCT